MAAQTSKRNRPVAIGTIQIQVAEEFYPLRSTGSMLWRTSLLSLRERFADAVRNHPAWACVVIRSNAFKLIKAPIPGHISKMEDVDRGVGPRYMNEMEHLRYVVYGPPHYWDTLYPLASDAGGVLLSGLPLNVNRILWREWLDGFRIDDRPAMWICAVFELAWQKIPGSALAVERFAWSGAQVVPVDQFPSWRGSALLSQFSDRPAQWYSVIENVASASVEAIDILLAIDDQGLEGKTANAGTPPLPPARHSVDFRSVEWFGTQYSFTVNQAPVVRTLWESWENGTPDVGDETLLSAVDPEAPPARLSTLFRDNPAWGTMIDRGGSKGTHRLVTPET